MVIKRFLKPIWVALFSSAIAATASARAQATPLSVRGSWRITKILPTHSAACWDAAQAKTLLGTMLTYEPYALLWSRGKEAIPETLTRSLSARQFQEEYSGHTRQGASDARSSLSLKELGIASASVVELDLQHEDEDVTGATTEVPGDTVLLAGPGRIVVSACGVYYSAVRVGREPQGGR